MMIPWFEDKITMSIPPTEESLARLSRYAQVYADHGQVAASLACVLCRLVVECKVKRSSVYGALQSYTGEGAKVYYLPNLPISIEYQHLETFLHNTTHYEDGDLKCIGCDLCAIFPLAKRLGVDPDHLLFVAIVAAELLMRKVEGGEEVKVPIELTMEQVRLKFGL